MTDTEIALVTILGVIGACVVAALFGLWLNHRPPKNRALIPLAQNIARTISAETVKTTYLVLVWLCSDEETSKEFLPHVTAHDLSQMTATQAYRTFIDVYNPPIGTSVDVYAVKSDGSFERQGNLTVQEPAPPRKSLVNRYGADVTK